VAVGFSVAASAGKTAKGAVKAKRQIKIIKKWKLDISGEECILEIKWVRW
jgi:hypothetical protein